VAAIQEQAARLCTIAPQHANDVRGQAASLIVDRAPEGFSHVFFTNGGADAVEHAVRMARLHTGRRKVLSRYRSYHGGTDTAVNLTGDPRRYASDYGAAGVVHFNGPFLYRSSFYAKNDEQESQRALDYLERLIAHEGPDSIAAIILESVPGTAGIMVPPPGYLAGVRDICNRHGIVFIADEVMAGFGRTGKWFAIENFDVVPDLITFAKGVTSGYVPLGGVAINDAIFATFAEEFGFVGCITLLALYAATIAIALRIASISHSHFGRLSAAGVTATFSLYVLINAAMVVGMAPVVGVPMPLMSYGGTGMVTVMIGFGLVQAVRVHRYAEITSGRGSLLL
jgi:4-aminobutyrate aminotransferase-like enzyme